MRRKDKIAISMALCLGIGLLLIAAFSGGENRPDISVSGNPAIDALIPARESEILSRDLIGIDLADGYEGAIAHTANGVRTDIPTDQLEPNFQENLGEYTYRPGENKILESLPAQSNCVIATYWPIIDRSDTKIIQWCFEVT